MYVAGFAEGTAAHVVDLVRGGLDVYESFPYAPVRALFLALVVLDPLVVLLLLRVPVAGVAAGALVMTLDLAANLTANAADIAATPARTLPGMTPPAPLRRLRTRHGPATSPAPCAEGHRLGRSRRRSRRHEGRARQWPL
ncbi:hypothetical protein [Streptomyces sp. SolWspMP-sol7th]|uniref:hypothetical protein n=1 Tax=Streptomyces sp. SolWspMP-sol7th TaxID=1839776 RepID=UPI000A6F61E4|nr:hypothetical protein [Streptomyces sp. SolWspMP-sol7th]